MKEKIWLVTSFILGTFLLVAFFALWQAPNRSGTGQEDKSSKQTFSPPGSTSSPTKPTPLTTLTVSPEPFNWGNIKIGGGIVEKTFALKNNSDQSVKVSKIETSCMCTEASLKVGDKESPFFGMPGHQANPGWQAEITPGQEVTLRVKFDPAAHGPEGLGKVTRVTRIWFSQPENSYRDVAFVANVVK